METTLTIIYVLITCVISLTHIVKIDIRGIHCFLTGGHKGTRLDTYPYERVCNKCGKWF